MLILTSVIFTTKCLSQTTKIWIVHHAEKSTNHPTNPDLSTEGQKRALDLAAHLRKHNINAVFISNFKRTQQTAQPTANKNNLQPIIYDPSNLNLLVENIKAKQSGKNILIIGHSNTLLETVEALGAKKPVDKLTDDDYDFIFLVKLQTGKPAIIKTKRYGKKHHVTVL